MAVLSQTVAPQALPSASPSLAGPAASPTAPQTPAPYLPSPGPEGSPLPKLTTPSPVPFNDASDGCDNAYGSRSICVPWTFPPGTSDGCEWLADHGFALPLQVHGRDRHHLDSNNDGSACGNGD